MKLRYSLISVAVLASRSALATADAKDESSPKLQRRARGDPYCGIGVSSWWVSQGTYCDDGCSVDKKGIGRCWNQWTPHPGKCRRCAKNISGDLSCYDVNWCKDGL